MKITPAKWQELRAAVAGDDRETFTQRIGEIVAGEKAKWDPRGRATSVIDFEGRKFYCFDQ